MKGFNRICAVIVGIVFFVSGVLKLMDPLGTSLIVEEYLNFLHIGFLRAGSKLIGICLGMLEAVTGAALITGVWRKLTATVSGILLGIFTIITLILLIANPNMDCGCFGQALELTHTQSFIKNLVLLLLWYLAFHRFKKLGEPQRIKYVGFTLAVIALCLFTMYSLLSIPLQDFTSMKPGTEILGAADDNFDDITAYIYEKNGHEGAFTEDCPPDSSWTFVRTESYNRSIIDEDDQETVSLSFSNAAGEYMDSLATTGPVMIISAYKPEKLKQKTLDKLSTYAVDAQEVGYTVLFLCAGDGQNLAASAPVLMANFYSADPRTLMTLNRANGGITYLRDGQIVSKWSPRKAETKDALEWLMTVEPTEFMLNYNSKGKIHLQAFLLYSFAVMILL